MFLATHLIGFGGMQRAQPRNLTTEGTNIGNMTQGGGISAAFDDNTAQNRTSSAELAASSTGFVGKQWAQPVLLTACVVYASTTHNFAIGTGSDASTLTLRGSNDGTNWVTLDTASGSYSPSAVVTFSAINTSTDYLYHSVLHSSAFNANLIAEVTFTGS
jgi:hypothetical protein